MKPAIVFPQYALVVWTLCAPLVAGVIEWFVSRRDNGQVVTRPTVRPAMPSDRNLAV